MLFSRQWLGGTATSATARGEWPRRSRIAIRVASFLMWLLSLTVTARKPRTGLWPAHRACTGSVPAFGTKFLYFADSGRPRSARTDPRCTRCGVASPQYHLPSEPGAVGAGKV